MRKSWAALTVICLMAPTSAAAQHVGRTVGLVVGHTASQQLWKPTVVGADRGGLLVGAFTEVPLPRRVFRIRAGADYVQRGGLVSGDFDGTPLSGEVRSDYLSLHLDFKFARSVGPLHIFIAAGPGYDQLLRTRLDAVLGQVLSEEHPMTLNVAGSGGIGGQINHDLLIELEARWVRGLSDAYSGSFLSVKNRSLELTGRVARVRR